jgi:Mg-chelatase subunit ChlD
VAALLAGVAVCLVAGAAQGQPALHGYALKIFRVESGLYPFVEVYFRTFDQDKQPLINLNELNIGLMVDGRSYDPAKRQYVLQSLRARKEAIRTILVLDASTSMKPGFDDMAKAATQFIDSKRDQDQIAILVIRDTKDGWELVSNFERDGQALGRRLADVKCDGVKSRLYDSIGAAMQMAAMPSQGGADEAEYIVSNSIIVFSDGLDEGSAISREELQARITALAIPIPIYSIAYSKASPAGFRNLEALSRNSFGEYYEMGAEFRGLQKVIDGIQNVLQSDYVLTFRSYVPVDGRDHNLKVGVEYPSKSGKFTYQGTTFEAIEPPPVPAIDAKIDALAAAIPPAPGDDPYFPRRDLSSKVAEKTAD